MKAQELRIGNLITSKNYYGDYWEVTADDIAQIYDNQFAMPDQYIPLPLTSEWLERFGFHNITVESDLNVHYRLKLQGMSIEYEIAKDIPWCFVEGIGIDCSHVHQLQNLYFALTGMELELTQTAKP